MKRILIWSLIIVLFLNHAALVYADEVSDETIDLVDIFYTKTTGEDHSLHVPFNRSWFRNDARVYNHDLAKLSLGLATSAFRPESPLSKKASRQTIICDPFWIRQGLLICAVTITIKTPVSIPFPR